MHILTIGAATRDIFVQSHGFLKMADRSAPDGFDTCIPAGAKIPVDHLVFETGGGATNAAVTFARFGLKTSCAARVGNDADGEQLREALQQERIDVSAIQTDPEDRTGTSIITLAGTGQRAILVYRGASARLDAAKIPWKTARPDWVYLTSLGDNITALKRVFADAKRYHARIAWNPGGQEIALGLKKLTPFITETDFFIVNREEAAAIANVPPRHLASVVHLLGPLPKVALCITDGAKGAYLTIRGTTWHAPALNGKRVNTTGAGDAFGSAFVAACVKTGNLQTGMRAAALNAIGVVTHMGAKAGILKRMPNATSLSRVKLTRVRL